MKNKKIGTLLLAVVMCLSLVACGGEQSSNENGQTDKGTNASNEKNQYYKLGDTVSTDIFEFTLNAAAQLLQST